MAHSSTGTHEYIRDSNSISVRDLGGFRGDWTVVKKSSIELYRLLSECVKTETKILKVLDECRRKFGDTLEKRIEENMLGAHSMMNRVTSIVDVCKVDSRIDENQRMHIQDIRQMYRELLYIANTTIEESVKSNDVRGAATNINGINRCVSEIIEHCQVISGEKKQTEKETITIIDDSMRKFGIDNTSPFYSYIESAVMLGQDLRCIEFQIGKNPNNYGNIKNIIDNLIAANEESITKRVMLYRRLKERGLSNSQELYESGGFDKIKLFEYDTNDIILNIWDKLETSWSEVKPECESLEKNLMRIKHFDTETTRMFIEKHEPELQQRYTPRDVTVREMSNRRPTQIYLPGNSVSQPYPQTYSPRNSVPQSQSQTYSPRHSVPQSQPQTYSPRHSVPQNQTQMYSPGNSAPQTTNVPNSGYNQSYVPQHNTSYIPTHYTRPSFLGPSNVGQSQPKVNSSEYYEDSKPPRTMIRSTRHRARRNEEKETVHVNMKKVAAVMLTVVLLGGTYEIVENVVEKIREQQPKIIYQTPTNPKQDSIISSSTGPVLVVQEHAQESTSSTQPETPYYTQSQETNGYQYVDRMDEDTIKIMADAFREAQNGNYAHSGHIRMSGISENMSDAEYVEACMGKLESRIYKEDATSSQKSYHLEKLLEYASKHVIVDGLIRSGVLPENMTYEQKREMMDKITFDSSTTAVRRNGKISEYKVNRYDILYDGKVIENMDPMYKNAKDLHTMVYGMLELRANQPLLGDFENGPLVEDTISRVYGTFRDYYQGEVDVSCKKSRSSNKLHFFDVEESDEPKLTDYDI